MNVTSHATEVIDVPSARRLPRSGNAALAAGALIQGVVGNEFVLTGLSKFADSRYLANFRTFVQTSPGVHRALFGALMRVIVLPHASLAAQAARLTEVTGGSSCWSRPLKLSEGDCADGWAQPIPTNPRWRWSPRSPGWRSPGSR